MSENTATAQSLLDLTVRDNRRVMDELTKCFVELSHRIDILNAQLSNVGGDAAADPAHLATLMQVNEVQQLINEHIEHMQVHDITDQRLVHIARLLADGNVNPESVVAEERERELIEMLSCGMEATAAVELIHALPIKKHVTELF